MELKICLALLTTRRETGACEKLNMSTLKKRGQMVTFSHQKQKCPLSDSKQQGHHQGGQLGKLSWCLYIYYMFRGLDPPL